VGNKALAAKGGAKAALQLYAQALAKLPAATTGPPGAPTGIEASIFIAGLVHDHASRISTTGGGKDEQLGPLAYVHSSGAQ